MKLIRGTAFVVSVHYENGALRLNLKWQGNHDISAFDLDRLGKVVHCETETEDTGWVIIEPYNRLNTYPRELLPPFGPSAPEPSLLVSPGDAVPLRDRGPAVLKSPIDSARFSYRIMVCAKEGSLVRMARCFAEELAKWCCRSGIRGQHG